MELLQALSQDRCSLTHSCHELHSLHIPWASPAEGFLKLSKQICIKYKFWTLLEQHSFKPKTQVIVLLFLKISVKVWMSAMPTTPWPG